MQCPACGSAKTFKNGGGRRKCNSCNRSWEDGMTVHFPGPAGHAIKGVSTLHDADGVVRAQWVKTSVTEAQRESLLHELAQSLAGKLPREPRRSVPKHVAADLANCYVVTDFHLGMLAWHEETGADWDTTIAEKLLVDWFAAAIQRAPDAAVGIFAQLGDLLHWDGLEAVTPASKHLLDADTRFQKLVRVVIRVLRRIIGMLLEKHAVVVLKIVEGNHDPAASAWLRELLAALYEFEPRIEVDVSPDPYYCYEHGLTSIFFHHGHKRKPNNIHDVFAAKFREVFGRTKYSYAHMGHMHHIEVKETNLMVVEQHRTLAAPDAYASRGGWISGRSASVITYHKQFGEVGRITLSPQVAGQ